MPRRIVPQDITGGGGLLRPVASPVGRTPSVSPVPPRALLELAPLSSQISQALVTNAARNRQEAAQDARTDVSAQYSELQDLSPEEREKALRDLPQSSRPGYLVAAQETFGGIYGQQVERELDTLLASGKLTELDAEGQAPDYESMIEEVISKGRENLRNTYSRRGYEAVAAAARVRVSSAAATEVVQRYEAYARYAATQEITAEILKLANSHSTSGTLPPGPGIVTSESFGSIQNYLEGLREHDWQDIRSIAHDAAYAAVEQIAELDTEKALEVADAFSRWEVNGAPFGNDATREGDRLRALEYTLSERLERERIREPEERRIEILKQVDLMRQTEGAELLKLTGQDVDSIKAYAEEVGGSLVAKYNTTAQEEFNSMVASLLKSAENLRGETIDSEEVASIVAANRNNPDYQPWDDEELTPGTQIAVARELEKFRGVSEYLSEFRPYAVAADRLRKLAPSDKLHPSARSTAEGLRTEIEDQFHADYTAFLEEQVLALPENQRAAAAQTWLRTEGAAILKPLQDFEEKALKDREQFRKSYRQALDKLDPTALGLVEEAYEAGAIDEDEVVQRRDRLQKELLETQRLYTVSGNDTLKEAYDTLQFMVKETFTDAFDDDTLRPGVVSFIAETQAAFVNKVRTRIRQELPGWSPLERAENANGIVAEIFEETREKMLTEGAKRFLQAARGEEGPEGATRAGQQRYEASLNQKAIQDELATFGSEKFKRDSEFLRTLQHDGDSFNARVYDDFTAYVQTVQGRRGAFEANVSFDRFNRSAVARASEAADNDAALLDLARLRGIPSSVLLSDSKTYTFDLSDGDKKALRSLSIEQRKRLQPTSFQLDPSKLNDPWNVYIDFGQPIASVPAQTITKVMNTLSLSPDKREDWVKHQQAIGQLYGAAR